MEERGGKAVLDPSTPFALSLLGAGKLTQPTFATPTAPAPVPPRFDDDIVVFC